jgi:hypothetical protein
MRQSRNQKETANLTTKHTKSTKFYEQNIRTLRGLLNLRGENIFHQRGESLKLRLMQIHDIKARHRMDDMRNAF